MSRPQLDDHHRLLEKLDDRLEIPMLVLSFVWLVLMIFELTEGLSPFLEGLNSVIWILFILDFLVKVFLAPSKWKYIKTNWLTTIALFLPALRLFRIFRAVRLLRATSTLRTLRLARVFTSINRGMSALGQSLGRRGFGYVLGLTAVVTLAGAAGMLSFEKENGIITDYAGAVWWTAMTLTTMGSDYFPRSAEGRLLCLALAIYGFAIFGYVTATVASFFVQQENKVEKSSELLELSRQLELLREETRNLQKTIQGHSRDGGSSPGSSES